MRAMSPASPPPSRRPTPADILGTEQPPKSAEGGWAEFTVEDTRWINFLQSAACVNDAETGVVGTVSSRGSENLYRFDIAILFIVGKN